MVRNTHVKEGLSQLLGAGPKSAPISIDNTRAPLYGSLSSLERKQFTQNKQRSCISNLKSMYFSKKISNG